MNSTAKNVRYRKTFTNITILLVVLIISLFGISYAWYSFTNKDINIDTATGNWEYLGPCNMGVEVATGNIVNIKTGNTSDSYEGQGYVEFSIVNKESTNLAVNIDITEMSIPSELRDNYFMYTIVDSETNKKVGEGNFSKATEGGSITISTNVEIVAEKTNNYKLYLWIKDDKQCEISSDGVLTGKCSGDLNSPDYNTQNGMMNKKFSGKMAATIVSGCK